MSDEYKQLIKIRQQKEQQQRILVQNISQEIADKKSKLSVLEQSKALFQQQKATLEQVFFSQIEGQQIKPDSLAEYQEQVRQINQFEVELNTQHEAMIEDINSSEAYLIEQQQVLTLARNNVEKIEELDDEHQSLMRKKQLQTEEAQLDEQAAEVWNSH